MAGKQRRLAPKFGARLRALRVHSGKRRSYEFVVGLLRERFGITSIAASTLHRYERGRVPDAAALWGLAQVYRQDPNDLFRELVGELAGQELPEANDRTNAVLDPDELACLLRFRALSPADQTWFMDTLGRAGGARSAEDSFRALAWNGVERRTGERRRIG